MLEEVRRASQEAEQASHGHGSGDQGCYNPTGGGTGHGYDHADPKISVNEDDLQTEIPGKDIFRESRGEGMRAGGEGVRAG